MSLSTIALNNFRSAQVVLGCTAILTRGAQSSTVHVLPGQKNYRVADSNGAMVTFSSHDMLIKTADYAFGGVVAEPRRGDQFSWVVGGRLHTFEVHFPDITQPPFAWSDPQGQILRVHTQMVSEAAA